MEDKIKKNRRQLESVRSIISRLESIADSASIAEIKERWDAAMAEQQDIESGNVARPRVIAVTSQINRICADILDLDDSLYSPGEDLAARVERLESRSRLDHLIIARMSDCILDLAADIMSKDEGGAQQLEQNLAQQIDDRIAQQIEGHLAQQQQCNQLVSAAETREIIADVAEQMQMQIYSDVIAEINAEVAPRIASMAEWISFSTADGGEIVTQYRRESEARLNGDLLLLTDGSSDARLLSAHVRTFRAYDTPDDFSPAEREENEAVLALTGPPPLNIDEKYAAGAASEEPPNDVPDDLFSMIVTEIYGGEYTDHETTYTRSLRAERERILNPDAH